MLTFGSAKLYILMDILAYSRQLLDNIARNNAIERYALHGLFSDDTAKSLHRPLSERFYQPNIWVRIGLFLLTGVVVGAAIGLWMLLFEPDGPLAMGANFMLLGTLVLVLCEWRIIRQLGHYRSGIDDALQYIGVSMWLSGLVLVLGLHAPDLQLLIWAVGLAIAAVRYTDSLICISAAGCLLNALLYFIEHRLQAKGVWLHSVMVVFFCIVCYWVASRLRRQYEQRFWHEMLFWAAGASLLVLYAGVHYTITLEGQRHLLIDSDSEAPLPFARLYWVLTAFVPALYIAMGLYQRERLLIWAGLLCSVAATATFHYHFATFSASWTLAIGGTVACVAAVWAIRALRGKTYPFTDQPENMPTVVHAVERVVG